MHINREKVATFLSALLILFLITPISSSFAATTGSAPCITSVTTSATVKTIYTGGNCYIVFTGGANNWIAPSNVSSVSILVIGGGGAGGSVAWGGGGGAGGIVWDTSYPVTPSTSYSLTVGDSGTPGPPLSTATSDFPSTRSQNGGDTWFYSNSTFVAKGGGAGSSYAYSTTVSTYCDGAAGGSGGGATECNVSGHTNAGGTTTQTLPTGANLYWGYVGGNTATNSNQSGGGGGGSGGVGKASAASQSPGAGGDGTTYFKPLLTAIASLMPQAWQDTTTNGNIAGGGGGAASAGAAGGAGGGGAGGTNGVNYSNGTSGVPNTGSGGGGASCCGPIGTGGYGGSGLIVIQYASNINTSISIALAGNATTGTYRSPITINATTVNNNANVKFFQNGKVIPGCQSVASVNFQASCTYRPSIIGQLLIKAVLVASGGFYSSNSLPVNISVAARAGKR